MSVKRSLVRVGNRFGVWMYRVLDGRLSGGRKDVLVLVITTPGRRTGIPRSTCVRFLNTHAGFVVWGTGSGSPRDPDWFRNLRAAVMADVQVRAGRLQVRPRELVGAERDEQAGRSRWPFSSRLDVGHPAERGCTRTWTAGLIGARDAVEQTSA